MLLHPPNLTRNTADQFCPPIFKRPFQLSALAHSDSEITPDHKAPATRTVAIEHSEPLELDRPLVMVAVSSSSAADQTTPMVYAVRYVFSPPMEK